MSDKNLEKQLWIENSEAKNENETTMSKYERTFSVEFTKRSLIHKQRQATFCKSTIGSNLSRRVQILIGT